MKLKPGLLFTITMYFCCIACLLPLLGNGQAHGTLADEVKDSIVAKFNRNDYKGIYLLFDTSFSNKISEGQLVNFLKGN